MKKIFFPCFFLIFVLSSCAQKNIPIDICGKADFAQEKTFAEKNTQKILHFFKFPQKIPNQNVSLCAEISVGENPGEDDFEIGFLSDEQFKSKKGFGALVFGKLSDTKQKRVQVEIMLDSNSDVAGFFFKSAKKDGAEISNIKIAPARIGVDFSKKIPIFAFSKSGGTFADAAKFDFEEKNPFGNGNAFLSLKFRSNAESDATAKLTLGGEKFTVRIPRDEKPLEIPLASTNRDSPFPIVVQEGSGNISAMMLYHSKETAKFKAGTDFVLNPIKMDIGLSIYFPKKNWRGKSYELFEWDRFPGVLLFDIEDYEIQNDFFRRLAFFVEKAGYRGKLLSDSFLADKHGYNAHDYRAESLAEFFEKARAENFPLNEKELLLKDILAENGVIKIAQDGAVSAGKGAVISISQSSTFALRAQFVAHEGWHGIFFVDEEFRDFVYSEFEKMDKQTRAYLIRYFQVTPSLNYDIRDKYLLRNEFMAYMLERPVREIARYYIDKANRKHSQDLAKEEADYIIETEARGFTAASRRLNDYVNKRWNLAAGRVWLMN